MGEKIVVGPIDKGLRTDRTAFVIDNDSFPVLINAYQWRGRVKRKRGTSLIGRLRRFFNSASTSYSPFATIGLVGGAANILTGFNLQANGNIVPGSVIITDMTATEIYTDPGMAGILVGSTGGSGTISYATGMINIVGGNTDSISVQFLYYPDLPVMGLEDINLTATQFPTTMAFDTVYSYLIQSVVPYSIYDVSFYKNPTSGSYLGYTAKTVVTPTSWNGQDYQQFWTVNYQGALWATNGINVPFLPFSPNNVGMQYAPTSTITYVSNTATTLVVTITNCPLVIGDFVFVNEWTGTNAASLNFQSGFVTAAAPDTPPLATKTLTITFPNAAIGAGPFNPGIIQYLTNRSDPTLDSLRWYDGDPTDGNPTTPTLSGHFGWVNFAPPLSQFAFSIGGRPAGVYYLVGARMIVPFKDRLLFIGPVIQTSSPGTQVYLQDTIIYSQNGTPYYTASFTGAINAQTVYNPILVPTDQTATASAYWEDVTGLGGFETAGYAQPILSVSPNQDVLILGFSSRQANLVYTGNDDIPFNFYIINSELGTGSTFSIINMDRGVLTTGDHGIIITDQNSCSRFDLDILDQIFQFQLTNNGAQRITAQRDFINEWVYFTYVSNQTAYIYPTQTLQYNYRDQSWAIFNESYTTYGQFRKATGYTWATVGMTYPTWSAWDTPWDSGSSTLMQPKVIAGNQQGFVMERESDTGEEPSLYIQGFSGNTVTSPNHCLNAGDYIIINGAIGTIADSVNGMIFSVFNTTQNTFMLNPSIGPGSGEYIGGGTITRMYVPFIQTKQFPPSWGMSRKTRIGVQQYLLSTTPNGQIELLIYLSENANTPYSEGPIVPAIGVDNSALIYNTTLYTSPEYQVVPVSNISLGLLGDSVDTVLSVSLNTSLVAGSLSIIVGTVATFTDNGVGGFTVTGTGVSAGSSVVYSTGQVKLVFSVAPTSQLSTASFNYYMINLQTPTAAQQKQIWHRLNTSLLGDTVQLGFTMSDSQMRDPTMSNQFAEIELHGFIIDVSPSQVLA